MASATFIKDAARRGFVPLLMLGLITSSVLVSGETTVSGASTMATTMSAGGTAATMTQASATTMPGATPAVTVQSTTSGSASTASGLTQATTPGATTQSPTTAMQSVMATTPQSATTTMQSVMTTTTQSPIKAGPFTQPPSMATTSSATTAGMMGKPSITSTTASGPTSPSSPMASSSGSMMSTMQATTGMADMNGTAMSNLTSMNMIYCPAFTCNYSDCYSMYMSNNATSCPEDCYCQMLKQTDMCYVASCVASCAESCGNSSRTNCSVGCCKSTGCLNETFALMMMMATTTVMPTTTTTTTVTTTTVTIPTTADNANKCNQGQCTGSTCYTTFANSLQKCSSTDKHCQLKKETVNGNTQWTAGCTTNCSDQTTCKANVQPPCHHECCNATVTSCLFLNGTLNVPSFATRGPHLHTEVIASLLCLLAISFLL